VGNQEGQCKGEGTIGAVWLEWQIQTAEAMNPNSHFHSLACHGDLVLVTHKKGTHETERVQQLLKRLRD
jgi:hypothetical protein